MSEKAENALVEAARLKKEELRAINMAVAENVMGWRRRGFYREWHPTKNIEDAFEVVEKLRVVGYEIDIRNRGKQWLVLFSTNRFAVGLAEHKFLPLAICEAALKAVEQQEAKR